ncbi:MAG: hypothetical protein PHI40_02565 [Caldisericia bacterium]|nr:hypothetical protein [Caldisericia bacterium]MDD4614276.1 hypothetical protein [Caldisericia bacterium]
MKKNDLHDGMIIGFSIGLLTAFLTTPTKGVLFDSNKQRSFHAVGSSFFKILESILKKGLCKSIDGSVKRSEK